ASNFADPDAKTIKTLDDANMTVAELATWAGTSFDAISKMIVLDASDSACDLTLTRLQHLDGTLLDDGEFSRLHRFVRLWRQTGWSVQDLDRAMVALQAPDITPRILRQLGQIVQLRKMLELSPQQLVSFWGSIPIAGDDALYRKLFLNKAVRDIDPIFLAVNGEYLTATDLKIGEHVPALLAGLRTRATDLALIREHVQWTVPGTPPTLATLAVDEAPLTLATATILYRYVTLARALKMAVKDLIALQAHSGKNPFSKLSDTNLGFDDLDIDPARTLGFVRLADRVAQSGFTSATLGYLFNSLTDAPRNFAPTDESIQLLLATIREGLVRIAIENVLTDDPTGELTRAKLSLLFEPHVVEQIAGLVAGTSVYSAPLPALPAGIVLPEGKVSHDEKSRLLKTSAWLTDTEKAALLALSIDDKYQKAVQSLYDQPRNLLMETLANRLAWKSVEKDLQVSVLEATSIGADGKVDPALVAGTFKAFLARALPYFRIALSRAFVKQTFADALSLEPATAALLLEGSDDVVLLGTDADPTTPSIADFLALVGDGLTADYFANETLKRVDPAVDFRWDAKRGFSVRWQGKVLADKTQTYQFHLRAGGGVRFTIDGKLPWLIDQWNDTAPTEYTVARDMEAGKFYDLKLEYFNLASVAADESPALVELRWSGPATPAEIVPSYRLYSAKRGDASKAAEQTYIR
ncbi:MAG: PA14 domain-containing protein, partial [Acidobacteriales bacterium]|nr:PA14 domain-containing protein [Terriglobales bacterium]